MTVDEKIRSKSSDAKDGEGRSESIADADAGPCTEPPRQSIAWSYSSEQLQYLACHPAIRLFLSQSNHGLLSLS
jgi:hypothetical protein